MEITEENQSDSFNENADNVDKLVAGEPVSAEPSSANQKQPTAPWKLMFARIFLSFVLYVLSFGPMYWFWFKSMYLGGDSIFVKLYAPLLLLAQNDMFGEWLQKYVEWWIL